MEFTQEEINEFRVEAGELLDQAEKSLLAMDRGDSLKSHYDAIFRAFHSIKGAAGMMEMTVLQKHMHLLESRLTEQKAQTTLGKEFIDLFLRGSDAARRLLEGEHIDFDYSPKAPPVAAAVSPSTESARPTSTTEIGRVLVVDDEPEIVELLVEILSRRKFAVEGLTESDRVLDRVKAFKPNVVLTDVAMPKLNGVELLKLVSEFDPDLPVVFISGNVTKQTLLDGIDHGVFGVIEKPFNTGRVIECCIQAVQKNQLTKLVSEGITLLKYQFADLDEYLKATGKEDVRRLVSTEIKNLIVRSHAIRAMRTHSK